MTKSQAITVLNFSELLQGHLASRSPMIDLELGGGESGWAAPAQSQKRKTLSSARQGTERKQIRVLRQFFVSF